jgi:hypothetical protein
MQLQLPNVIAFIGSDLAQVLTLSKNFGVALSVLNEAEAAFVKLQTPEAFSTSPTCVDRSKSLTLWRRTCPVLLMI